MNRQGIAKVCHEVNRAYCAAIGDFDTVPWEAAPQGQVDSCLAGVAFHLENEHDPEASHESWLRQKEEDGWIHGEEKDEELKIHPCMVPYVDLPVEQKAKDFLFAAVVQAISSIKDEPAAPVVVPVLTGKTSAISGDLIPVKYVGVRDVYTDGMFGTGLTFIKGETKLVTVARAVKMLLHPGVYVPGDTQQADTDVNCQDEEKTEEKTEDDDKAEADINTQDAKDSVMAMKQKAPILEFAARNFSSVVLDNKHTVADLQREAIQMIDQFGIL